MFESFARIIIASLGLASASQALDRPEVHGLSKESLSALTYFTPAAGVPTSGQLQRIRPHKLDPAVRARVLANLPQEGEAAPSSNHRAKLVGIDAILRYHERENEIKVKVIDVEQAFFGLHARTVVLISVHALELLDKDEVEAVVAHEMGHEYFWTEYAEAARRRDRQRLRELELRCDGVAVLTLLAFGRDTAAFESGQAKLRRFNESIGATANADNYVPHQERIRFVRALFELLRQR